LSYLTMDSYTKIKFSPFVLGFIYTLSSTLHVSAIINSDKLSEHKVKEKTDSSTSSLQINSKG